MPHLNHHQQMDEQCMDARQDTKQKVLNLASYFGSLEILESLEERLNEDPDPYNAGGLKSTHVPKRQTFRAV